MSTFEEGLMAGLLLVLAALLISLLFGFAGASMAKVRARDPSAWFLICALIPVLGLVALAQSPKVATADLPATRIPGVDVESEGVPEILEVTEEEGDDLARVDWMISKGVAPR
jgi:F0F1-type ATP synthase membrane subunit c/vacuolar-type H+-ATPase subunit K